MAIRSSYDSKINKTVQLKPIVLEIEKAMLHNEVHRFSDEIIFVSDDFKEVPPFIHPVYSPEKDIAFIDVRGFSSVGQDGNLTLKGDIDSELTVLRAKLELIWQRAPRADTFTALHFANTIFVRWLADTISHKHGLQLGHKSKVLAVTGLYMIGLYYNNITDDYQISKYAEMISRDFYIPLEEVFSVIDMLDNPFPRDVDEYVEALKQMQISPRLANLNTVGLYAMLGGSWFMTANASQLVGLAVEYPPCFAALVSMATRHKIFKKTQIGERVDRANKGGAFDQFARSLNTLINNNLGQINPNRQRAGMESIPYNVMIIDDEFFEQNIGMEGLTVGQGAALLVGGGFIAAFLTWLFSKFSGGGSGGGGLVSTAETKKDNIKDKLASTKKAEVEIAKVAHEIKSDASSNAEAMDVAIVEDAGTIVEKGADKKLIGIVDRVRNEAALPLISVAMKYEPSQEPANHWANMEALVRTIEHIEDPVQLAAIFEVYKRTLRDGDQMVKAVLTDFIKHPLFKKEIHFAMMLFSGVSLPYVQSQDMMELSDQLLEASGPEMLDMLAYNAGMLHELHNRAADTSISDEELNKAARYQIETRHADIWMKLGSMIKRDVETDVMINGVKERVDYFWVNRRTTSRFDWPAGNYTNHFVEVFNRIHENVQAYEGYVKWLKGMDDHIHTQNKSSREWVSDANEAELWQRYAPDLRLKLRDVTQVTRFMVYTTGKAISVGMDMVNTASTLLDAYAAAQKAIEKNLAAMQKELARAGKKAGLESYEEVDGEFIPAQKGVGLEMNPWAELTARVGFALIVGMFVEWLVRKISGGSSGGGGGSSSRMSISFRVESAGEKLVRVGETLDKTKKDFLAFNSEVNRRKLKDEDLMELVKTEADKNTLHKFLSAIAHDDHLLRTFAVLIVNGASGKDESQFTFLGVSATDRDWEKWVLAALANFRKTSMPNDMEFEKYLLFCGMSIPGTFAIADVIEGIDIPKAMNHLEVESEIVEEIFKLGDEFTDADAKRIAEEIRKGASGPASDSKEVSIPGAQGKTYAEIFRHAALSRFTIWPGALFRNGLKADETLAEIKPDQWRTLLDTKRLSTKLAADKNTLERMESKAKYLQDRLSSATRKSNINGRFSSNPDDHETITNFLGKKSQAMYEIQSYLQAVNSYTRGVEMQATNMSFSCRTLEARIANVKSLLNRVD